MGLPFRAEPLEKLKERFPKALERVWVIYECMEDRPMLHREHLFDFEDGIRLGISRDKFDWNEEPVIHVSASFTTPVSYETFELLTRTIESHYKALGGKGNLILVGISQGDIPHWEVKFLN